MKKQSWRKFIKMIRLKNMNLVFEKQEKFNKQVKIRFGLNETRR